jgi:hypothetical protein
MEQDFNITFQLINDWAQIWCVITFEDAAARWSKTKSEAEVNESFYFVYRLVWSSGVALEHISISYFNYIIVPAIDRNHFLLFDHLNKFR